MSLQIHETIVLKINRQEYNLLMFLRNKLPYGKCLVFTQNGKPVRIERAIESIMLIETMGLDFSQGEKAGNSS